MTDCLSFHFITSFFIFHISICTALCSSYSFVYSYLLYYLPLHFSFFLFIFLSHLPFPILAFLYILLFYFSIPFPLTLSISLFFQLLLLQSFPFFSTCQPVKSFNRILAFYLSPSFLTSLPFSYLSIYQGTT